MKKGTLLIDSSTIDPAVSKEMALAAEKMGAVFMDAPVSGGKDLNMLLHLCAQVVGILQRLMHSYYFGNDCTTMLDSELYSFY